MTDLKQRDNDETSSASAAQVEPIVMNHDWGNDEGGYKLCKKCGTAKHRSNFDGFRFWYAGVGYKSQPGCF